MTNVKTALAKKDNKGKSLKQMIVAMQPEIEKALPSVMTPERFSRMILTTLSSDPKLQSCDAYSFLGAMMNAAQLGLEPNTPLGQAYLIPYGKVVQFQLGYKGLIDLAHRSGEFASIYAHKVHENDEFEYELGLDPKLVHKPAIANRGEVTMYYAVYKLTNGGYGFEVMSREDAKNHMKKFSKSYDKGPWKTDFDSMALKTVIKKVLKYAPIKTEFVKKVQQDETIKTKIDVDMADVEDETEYIDVEAVEIEE